MLFLKRFKLIVFITVIFSLSSIYAETMYQKNDCKEKLQEIDQEIQYLEDLKLGLEGRATRYENQAQRLQFEKDQLIEAKRFWRMADQNKQAAAELEQKIEKKKQERQRLMDKYNCKEVPSSTSSEDKEEPSEQVASD